MLRIIITIVLSFCFVVVSARKYDEFIYVENVDTANIKMWADDVRAEIRKSKISTNSIDSLKLVWGAAKNRTKKEIKTVRTQWKKHLQKALEKRGWQSHSEIYEKTMVELKAYDKILPLYVVGEDFKRLFEDIRNYAIDKMGVDLSMSSGIYGDKGLFNVNYAINNMLLTEDVYAYAEEYADYVALHNERIDSLTMLTDLEIAEIYSSKYPLPKKKIAVKNPDYNPAELEWEWIGQLDYSKLKVSKTTYPREDCYYIHSEYPQYIIRRDDEASGVDYTSKLYFAFENDTLSAVNFIPVHYERFLIKLLLAHDLENNKYDVNADGEILIRYIKDCIFDDCELAKSDELNMRTQLSEWDKWYQVRADNYYKEKKRIKNLNLDYYEKQAMFEQLEAKLEKDIDYSNRQQIEIKDKYNNSPEKAAHEKAKRYVEQLMIDRGIQKNGLYGEWTKYKDTFYRELKFTRINGKTFYIKVLSSDGIMYEIKAVATAELDANNKLVYSTKFELLGREKLHKDCNSIVK